MIGFSKQAGSGLGQASVRQNERRVAEVLPAASSVVSVLIMNLQEVRKINLSTLRDFAQ